MNFKKAILVFTLFSGIIGCECFNGGSEWNIADFELTVVDENGDSPMSGVVTGDSLYFRMEFEAEFVEHVSNPFSGMMNSAYATSCVHPGDHGMQDTIKNFIVTSNSDFNGIPSGEPLNELILAGGTLSIEDWMKGSGTWEFNQTRYAGMLLPVKPQTPSTHIFTLKFILDSGTEVSQSTEEIWWE